MASGLQKSDIKYQYEDGSYKYTGDEEIHFFVNTPNYNNYIFKKVDRYIQPGTKVLDYGAGIGTYAKLVQEENPSVDVICYEIDKQNVDCLLKNEMNLITDFKSIRLEELDLIYSLNVLEHIEDDLGALKQMHGALKKRGKIIMWLPAFQLLYSSFDVRVGHYRRYHKKDLSELFQKAGFSVDKVEYGDSVGFFLAFLFKYIGSKEGKTTETQMRIFDKFLFPISKILDVFLKYLFGKNVYIVATKV